METKIIDGKKISAEITNGQCAEIIKGQERRARTQMPRAERRVKCHPNAEDQKRGAHQMKQKTRQRHARGAVIAESRFPTDCHYEHRYQVSQQQRQEYKISGWMETEGEIKFPNDAGPEPTVIAVRTVFEALLITLTVLEFQFAT